MTYIPTIPGPDNIPSQSQGAMQTNFAQANSQFGQEHDAFDSAAADGFHKWVTLQYFKPPGPPSPAPAATGTNVIISQPHTPVGNPYLQVDFGNALGYPNDFYSIPLMASASVVLTGGTHTFNLVDFTAFGGVGSPLLPQTGTIFVYDNAKPTRSIFTTFVYVGGSIEIPGGAGQLISGSVLTGLTSSGSILQMTGSGLSNPTTINIKVTGNAI